MKISLYKSCLLALVVFTFSFGFPDVGSAQSINIDVSKLISKAEVSFSPRTGSFVEGSLFDVPILLNTKGSSVNGIEIKINFDSNRLSIVKPLIGSSIIGVWVEPPKYDNTAGSASYIGIIPNGVTTGSGLIGTITFKAKNTGQARISFSESSKILLNDGSGTEAKTDFGRAEYSILTKAPEGVLVYSETHQFQSNWYNNNSPSFSWDRDPGVSGFSFALDNKPLTIPENTINTNETTKSFENLEDGLWYFHIKANKNGAWGNTGHFVARVDTTPPVDFEPQINYLLGAVSLVERALITFFTTDSLSGLDHYEVGVIDKSESTTVSPVFVVSESPYQVPLLENTNLRVIVRAVDQAGNVRDSEIDVRPPGLVWKFIQEHLALIFLILLLIIILGMVIHYLVGHHVLRYIRMAFNLMKKEEQSENKIEENKTE
ncbi:MAG: hypothetical protein AB200_01560 [Parcubacteria bacterium C7867-005]|nr:MAG: hypothetical protein AB200_01560 [Parcubacteria bacterium C7867-005]